MSENIVKEDNKTEKEITNPKPYWYIDWSDPKVMESILKSSLEWISKK